MEENLNFKYLKIVADAGYESEENYSFIEDNNQVAFIKPANYEISKTRKYKNNMNFIRFMCREQNNVLAESILLAVVHNINKLHNKI